MYVCSYQYLSKCTSTGFKHVYQCKYSECHSVRISLWPFVHPWVFFICLSASICQPASSSATLKTFLPVCWSACLRVCFCFCLYIIFTVLLKRCILAVTFTTVSPASCSSSSVSLSPSSTFWTYLKVTASLDYLLRTPSSSPLVLHLFQSHFALTHISHPPPSQSPSCKQSHK